MRSRLANFLLPTLALALLVPLAACAESVEIPDPAGGKITLELHRPPDFEADTAYSILVGPGEYYWQDRPSQPGWIVVVSDAFYGERRVERSKVVLASPQDWMPWNYRTTLATLTETAAATSTST